MPAGAPRLSGPSRAQQPSRARPSPVRCSGSTPLASEGEGEPACPTERSRPRSRRLAFLLRKAEPDLDLAQLGLDAKRVSRSHPQQVTLCRAAAVQLLIDILVEAPDPPELRRRMVELVRASHIPEELSR